MNAIGSLYDTLKDATKSRGTSYSIHKKLDYEDRSISNLYDFLLDNFDLNQKSNILDCGCGVGFGSILLAKNLKANIKGISVSPAEIESANSNLKQESLTNLTFECKSFDYLDADKYDVIIAIESIKHSPKLSKSLASVENALKSGGKVYIIEDILLKQSNGFAEKKLKNDWILSNLYTEKEYTEFSSKMKWSSIDLTHMMRKPSKIEVAAKIVGTELKTKLDNLFNKSNSAASIFRGGFYQEWLYVNNMLNYKLLVGTKL